MAEILYDPRIPYDLFKRIRDETDKTRPVVQPRTPSHPMDYFRERLAWKEEVRTAIVMGIRATGLEALMKIVTCGEDEWLRLAPLRFSLLGYDMLSQADFQEIFRRLTLISQHVRVRRVLHGAR